MAFGNATIGDLKKIAGGGGGTTNYSELSNKPQINGVTLDGNKTSNQLNIGSVTTSLLYQASNTSQASTIELTESYANYDLLIMQGYYADNSNRYAQSSIYSKDTLDDILNNGGYFGIANNVGYLGYTFTDSDSLTKFPNSGGGFYISKIIGIKF